MSTAVARRPDRLVLAGFLALSALTAIVGGAASGAGVRAWYLTMQQPALSPPGWVFGPVWTILYAAMAIAAWRVWRRVGADRAIAVYLIQLALNAAWSGLFFGARRMDLALVDIGAMWILIAATIVLFARRDRTAAWMMVPYLAWVSFATYLNAAFLALN